MADTHNGEYDVQQELARDRRLYGASCHRLVDGRTVRVPPDLVVITGDGCILVNGEGGIVEQIATASEVSDG